jgi:hypothetical protein
MKKSAKNRNYRKNTQTILEQSAIPEIKISLEG